ncbi:MAG: polysaccharide deacetylase family protein, partial [Saprospiraceae bacterium]
MNKLIGIVILSFVIHLLCGAQNTGNWNGKKCAVVLTYDDALNIHLDKVIPQLNSYNFKGTFYLIGS